MSPLKALNSFAIRDLIDGNDDPLITIVAGVEVGCGAAAAVVKISVAGVYFILSNLIIKNYENA